jgi:putative peptidoglycan lipid II flippase
VARAALLTAVLTAAGALFGLLRDQTIARLFGAGRETDAFLIAWTLPEFAATLLIEDAMALVLVPAVSLALARRTLGGGGPDPVRALLAATLPRLLLALAVTAAACAACAPLLVRLLAPGLADPGLAADCTRLTAVTVLTFGIAGYLSAVLRAHHSFAAPAAIYVAYNLGIIAAALALHTVWGMRAAAVGVALGSLLMILVQLPSFARRTAPPKPVPVPVVAKPERPGGVVGGPGAPALGVVLAVASFAVSRQAQVLVERFLASGLPPGAISHLNFAQKVAQLPMVLSLMVATVTLPLVARAMAVGDVEGARRRVERDVVLAGVVVLLGAAYVLALAPQLVGLLFQRGAFDADDTAATAGVMRVYALGLLGHSLVGTLIRPFFSAGRPTWYPFAAMVTGLAITVLAGAVLAGPYGAPGIAAANAVGIAVTALLLLHGLSARMIPVRVGPVLVTLGLLLLAAAVAAAVGWAAGALLPGTAAALAAGALLVPATLLAVCRLLRVPEASAVTRAARRELRRLTRLTRRYGHARRSDR